MRPFFLVILIAASWPDALAQSSLPPCPKDSSVGWTTPDEVMATAISGWVLVALVNVSADGYTAKDAMPVTTNLTFPDLQSCLVAESEMRKQWADHWNSAKKAGMGKETLDMILGQFVRGTCVPHRIQERESLRRRPSPR